MERLYDMIFTTSLLIAVVILLRAVVRNKISMRLQYALWLLVAVKLLVFPVPRLESVLSLQQLSVAEALPQDGQQNDRSGFNMKNDRSVQPYYGESNHGEAASAGNAKTETVTRADSMDHIYHICTGAAAAGSVFLFLCFLAENIRFAVYLRRRRIPLEQGFPLPVFLVEGLPSPCMYGRAVYLAPEMAEDEKKRLHMLTHEYCHYRQGDLFWSFLRCLCVICYWWNPLVWIGAYLSKQDCELACDEAALKRLGETERISYGRTLLELVPVKTRAGDYFSAATTMTGGGKNMKKRITKIAHKSKTAVSVCVITVLLAGLGFVSVSTAKPAEKQTALNTAEADRNTLGEQGSPDLQGEKSSQSEEEARRQEEEERRQEEEARQQAEEARRQAEEAHQQEETAVTDLDEAVGMAVLSSNADSYASQECVAEGHILLETEQEDTKTTVYALTMYGEYGFENGAFIKGGGTGLIPAVMTFSYDEKNGYVLEDCQYPMDGSYYVSSIQELFPEKYWDRCIVHRDDDIEELTRQERIYARDYLNRLGRTAKIGDYADIGHPLLTDVGVSVDVSNHLWELEMLYGYPYWIGNLEKLEDGVRYVYEMSLDQKAGEIIYTKSVYDTKEVLEQIRIDMNTGEEIQ